MKTQFSGSTLMALLTVLSMPAAFAASGCAPGYQQVNSNNSIVMLGGTARGPIKEFVLGEFGKDINQQKRMLGQFDRCGALIRADIRFDKQEGNTQIQLVQSIERVTDGWRSVYDLSVVKLQDGEPVTVNARKGTINYMVGRSGNIASSSEAFMLQGEKGFTATIHYFDRQSRLIRSTSRGSDSNSNGQFIYRWNKKNQLISSSSERQTMEWLYDKQGRELTLNTREDMPMSSKTTQDECQLWDDRDNCTLSYSREMEVLASGIVRHNITAAYRFEYWQ